MQNTALKTLTDIFPNSDKKKITKGTILMQQGNKAHHAFYVTKGCLKSYVTDSAGKEHILQFAPEGWYITDMNSFFNGVDAAVSIDAIEDSEVIVFDKKPLTDIKDLPKEFLIIQVQTLQNNIIAGNKRLIHLLSSTAEERYLDFVATYPSLVQRLPLKLIASYLGITPEFLSRIRKNLAGK